ncbi:DUF3011 domain-containing protein [Gloeothece verrucosa]|uniref:DUF3011 domain-containing protein n=1 Tax=Gloeothece verrucosa (strain PCC 7822) TaxID=497965 RepID=E0UDT5_GLOV7|nr:DUF3011 domain-containing protein [Gloeothece verrucosa]ADN16520.1 hypothetical protein Cyan7822_4612 [Gloeothece verrucosa PCC 7822]
MFRKTLALTSCCCLLLSSNFLWESRAAAENTLVCESRKGRTQRCPMDTRGGVDLVEELSDTHCRDRWSYGRGYVEVRDGCRAKFAADGDHYHHYHRDDQDYNRDRDRNRDDDRDRITCASKDGETQRCRIQASGGVRLVRQLSNKSCQDNWRYHNGYVIVRNGCRAEFESRR